MSAIHRRYQFSQRFHRRSLFRLRPRKHSLIRVLYKNVNKPQVGVKSRMVTIAPRISQNVPDTVCEMLGFTTAMSCGAPFLLRELLLYNSISTCQSIPYLGSTGLDEAVYQLRASCDASAASCSNQSKASAVAWQEIGLFFHLVPT